MLIPKYQGRFKPFWDVPACLSLFWGDPGGSGGFLGIKICFGLIQTVMNCIYVIY